MKIRLIDGIGPQLISVLLNSFSVIFAKLALDHMDHWHFIGIYAFFSVIFAAPFVSFRSMRRFVSQPVGVLAIAAGGGGIVMFYAGLEVLDPASHSFVVRTYVVYGLLISWLALGERLTPKAAGLAAICFLGTLMAAWPENVNLVHVVAVLFTSLAAFLFAVNYAALRHLSDRTSASVPIVLTNTCLLLTLAVAKPESLSTRIDLYSAAIAAVSAGCLAASTYFFMTGSKRTPFWLATSVRAASPVVVLLLSLPFFTVSVSPANAIGATITILSVAFLGLHHSPRKNS
jgi:drug/metabolite transporter (DMT)-like permease